MTAEKIWIVVGSASDLPAFEDARALLQEFGVAHGLRVLSAHRSPGLLIDAVTNLPPSVQVIVAGAGGAAHLAGVIAAHTLVPVIGVPMQSALLGLDSLLSTAQMPAGVPVATMAVGKAGATNAVLFGLQMMARTDEDIRRRLAEYRLSLVKKVEEANRSLANPS